MNASIFVINLIFTTFSLGKWLIFYILLSLQPPDEIVLTKISKEMIRKEERKNIIKSQSITYSI